MSDNAKKVNMVDAGYEKIQKITLDFGVAANATLAVHTITGAFAPKDHYLTDATFYVKTACTSGGSPTLSMGIDSSSEPADILSAEALASIDADNDLVGGIPRQGTDATKINVGQTALQIYYEIKVAAMTAGKIVVTLIYKPYY